MLTFIIGFIAGGAVMLLAMCLAISYGKGEDEDDT